MTAPVHHIARNERHRRWLPWGRDGGHTLVCSQVGAQRLLYGDPRLWPDVIISIRGTTEYDRPLSLPLEARETITVHAFQFDDVKSVVAAGLAGYTPPGAEDAARIQRIAATFDPNEQRVLFHCAQGVARSTAACIGFWMALGCEYEQARGKMVRATRRATDMGVREDHVPKPNPVLMSHFGLERR